MCEELRKRRMDVCCLQEVRWRGQGAWFLGMKGRRSKLWWSRNSDGTGGVGVLVKDELCKKVVEVRRRCERVMTVVMVLEEEVLRIISVYGPQSYRAAAEEEHFYDDLRSEWDLHSMGELVLVMSDLNAHVGKQIKGYEDAHERNVEGKMLLEFFDEKELCVANTWFRKGEKRKVTYSAGGNELEIDFVLVGKENRKYLRDVKVIPGELQHRLVVVNLVKKKVVRRKVWKLKEDDMTARFEERVGELVSADAPDVWKCFREGMLKAFDDVCGKTKGRRDQGDTWWWSKEMCESGTEVNKARYKDMVVAKGDRS